MLSWNEVVSYENEIISHEEFLRKYYSSLTISEIAEVLDRSYDSIKHKKNSLGLDYIEPGNTEFRNKLIKFIKSRPRSLLDITIKFDATPKEILTEIESMKEEGYDIEEVNRKLNLPSFSPGQSPKQKPLIEEDSKTITIGIGSDIHLGSKKSQMTNLASFVSRAREDYNVQHFFWAGDITDGTRVYRGQEREIYLHNPTDQILEFNKVVPYKEDIFHHIIGGNHDYDSVKEFGLNPLLRLKQEREDVIYHGFSEADIPLTNKISLKMWHPKGAPGASKSFKTQKKTEALALIELNKVVMDIDDPKTRFIVCGHYHFSSVFPMAHVWGLMAGCFQGQTLYMLEKNLMPDLKAIVLELDITEDEKIRRFTPHFFEFEEIENDYLNYWSEPKEDIYNGGPLFKLNE